MSCININSRIWADTDNERFYDKNIVGFINGDSDEFTDFSGRKIIFHEGDYVYLYTENGDIDGVPVYIFAEGYIIKNPFPDAKERYKWCCKLVGGIDFSEDYYERYGLNIDGTPIQ